MGFRGSPPSEPVADVEEPGPSRHRVALSQLVPLVAEVAPAGLDVEPVPRRPHQLGAEYGVASTLGEGSDFWFRLPLLPPDAALTAESEENHSDFS